MSNHTSSSSQLSLRAGAAQIDITPRLPIRLCGQYYQRIAKTVYSPLSANILAIEDEHGEQAVLVSCDLLAVSREFLALVRRKLAALPDIPNPAAVILSAIHTHTAPYLSNHTMAFFWGSDFIVAPNPAAETPPDDYAEETAAKIAAGIADAWQHRRPVRLAAGFDHICIAYNRRTRYRDGHTEMYGSTARPDFFEMEGGSDGGIHFLLLRDETGTPVCAVIEAACPAQVMEHKSEICADYWKLVRDKVGLAMGNFPIVSLCGAAGDLSPRDLVRTACEEAAMHSMEMYNPAGMERVASRITEAFLRFTAEAVDEPNAGLHHTYEILSLPLRTVTEADATQAKEKYNALRAKHVVIDSFTEAECTELSRLAATVNRFALQQQTTDWPAEVHVLRLGSVIILTNPFELFVAYADRLRAASGNPNTLVVQLACGYEGYLPTAKAIASGGYSAGVNNGFLGAEGGDALVNESLRLLHNLPI